jgi:predicted metalloprotease
MRFNPRASTSGDTERRSGGGLGGLPGGGGGQLTIGGVVVAGLLYLVAQLTGVDVGALGLDGSGGQDSTPVRCTGAQANGGETGTSEDCQIALLSDSVQAYWATAYPAQTRRDYQRARTVVFSGSTSSGCGAAQSAMGPFYCPTDKKIYLDTEFFQELAQRFQAPGDFAQAYVIAHEVGHHVQDLMGTLDQAHNLQARSSETEGNAIQVKVELQADCYAGVWAKNAKDPEGRPVMEQGDFEEGMRAAEAIGDDTLQKQSQGVVVPDSFTHGTSAQRMEALRRGYTTGDPNACTF